MKKGSTADKFAKRRSLVGRLFNLGITMPAIATITGHSSVRNDLDVLKKGGTVFNRPDPEEVFSAILILYARILAGLTEDADLKPYLHQWLKIDEVKIVVRETEKVMMVLDQPQFTEQQERYHSFLISGIFGGRFQETPENYNLDDYFTDLVQGKIEPAQHFHALCAIVRSRVVNGWRHCIAPIWPANTDQTILSVVKSLAEPKGQEEEMGEHAGHQQQVEVITLRFGLDGQPPLTLEEVAKKMKLTRERVRQIESKAVRRLRHPSRSKFLTPFLARIGRMMDNQHLLPQSPVVTTEELRNKSVEDLEISVRTANGLRHMRIQTIGGLVALSTQDIVERGYLGRKSIEELKQVLGSLGIDWGK